MNKKGRWALWVGIVFVLVLVVVLFFYFVSVGPNNESKYNEQKNSGVLKNPASNLTLEEAMEELDEEYIYYMLYQIKAYNLHNPPLSEDTPKIEILVDELSFNAEIINGEIKVYLGNIENEDIVITTTKEEAVKMLNSKEYVSASFQEGKSYIELKASKTILFSKGYLTLYQELTQKSTTGSVVKMYSE